MINVVTFPGLGLSHDIGAAHDDAVLPRRVDPVLLQHPHDARRGAGLEASLPDHQLPHVEGVEAVHILVRPDGQQNGLLVQVSGQGQLDQDPVDVLPPIQGLHQLQQFLLAGLCREGIFLAVNAALTAVPFFSSDIDPGGGIVAHQHHGQTGLAPHLGRLLPDLLLDLGCQSLSVHDRCRHRYSSSVSVF